MDKATVIRLRLYALIYRLEDELKSAAALIELRSIAASSASLMKQYRDAVAYMPDGYMAELERRYEEDMRQRARRRMEALNEAALLLTKGFEITAGAFDELACGLRGPTEKIQLPSIAYAEDASFKYPERGFVGYCGNRSKYGPRKPKKR
jgi:hypothetical protein